MAYIDNIVIFSKLLEEHLQRLQNVFQELITKQIILSPKMSFLEFLLVHLFGQCINALGMATAEAKLAAIAQLAFPQLLKDLEMYLGLTGYLRQYIPYYAQVTKPLQEHKTLLGRSVNVAGNTHKKVVARTYVTTPTDRELNACYHLQQLFSCPSILAHYDPTQQLYIDLNASKAFNFGVVIYCSKNGESPLKKTSMKQVLFLSRLLTDAETCYWPTKLEIPGLVWTIKKVRHMVELEKNSTIVYTDCTAIISIARQTNLTTTTSTNKLNLRLVRALEYLQQFNLNVRHKPGKTRIISNALLRLASRKASRSSHDRELDALAAITNEIYAHPATLVELSNKFKQKLVNSYNEVAGWKRVKNTITANNNLEANVATLLYQIFDVLIYYQDSDLRNRLCLPGNQKLVKQAFNQVHDKMGYVGYLCTHQQLTQDLYICHMVKQLRKYLHHCPECQSQMTSRHLPYGWLQPIISLPRQFHTITIGFILVLPTSTKGYNLAMLVIDKYSKQVMFILGKITWGAEKWAIELFEQVNQVDWGLQEQFFETKTNGL